MHVFEFQLGPEDRVVVKTTMIVAPSVEDAVRFVKKKMTGEADHILSIRDLGAAQLWKEPPARFVGVPASEKPPRTFPKLTPTQRQSIVAMAGRGCSINAIAKHLALPIRQVSGAVNTARNRGVLKRESGKADGRA